jgi:hypothetical protein
MLAIVLVVSLLLVLLVQTSALASTSGANRSLAVGQRQPLAGGVAEVSNPSEVNQGGATTAAVESGLAYATPQATALPAAPNSAQRTNEAEPHPPGITNGGGLALTSGFSAEPAVLSFDGTDDQLSMGNSSALMLTDTDFTVEVWISTTQTAMAGIVGKHRPGGSWNGYVLIINGEHGWIPHPNKVWFYATEPPGEEAVSTTDINDGRWHHIAGVYHKTGAKELFVDGVLEASVPDLNPLAPNDAPFRVGYLIEGSSSYSLQGWVDEVRVWNVARTQAEIKGAMYAQLFGDEPGLVGYWTLDEGSGQTAHDSTLNHNDGQLGSTPGADPDDPSWVLASHPRPHIYLPLALR